MYNINIPWRSYKIHLPDLHAAMLSHQYYCGISAGNELTIHFTQEPSQNTKDLVQMHFDAITGASENAKIALYNNREAVVALAKEQVLIGDMLSFIPAERKILMNLPLTDADKDALILKYEV